MPDKARVYPYSHKQTTWRRQDPLDLPPSEMTEEQVILRCTDNQRTTLDLFAQPA